MDGTGKIAMMKELVLFFLFCVLFSEGEARIAPIWLKLVCAWVSLQLFKTSQPYIVQTEILSYSCKIIFRHACKAISCDKLHNLLLDQDSFRCSFSLDNQIMFCFKAVQLLPDAAPCRTSFLIASWDLMWTASSLKIHQHLQASLQDLSPASAEFLGFLKVFCHCLHHLGLTNTKTSTHFCFCKQKQLPFFYYHWTCNIKLGLS